MSDAASSDRLTAVTLDEASIGRGTPDQEHERAVAIHDLVERNHFVVAGRAEGPYGLAISLIDNKLALDIRRPDDASVIGHLVSLSPLRTVIRDYFLVCDSYHAAIRTATPGRIEAIDMGRRGLHDEAATILRERLAGKIDVDFETARRLFTLVVALHWKG